MNYDPYAQQQQQQPQGQPWGGQPAQPQGQPWGGPQQPQQPPQGQPWGGPQQPQQPAAQTRGLDDVMTGGAPGMFGRDVPVGTVAGGVIIDAEVKQKLDHQTKAPAFWNDGNPMEQVVIRVQTDRRESDADTGVRGIYVETWGDNFQRFQEAIRATGAAKATDALVAGNQLWARKIGTDPTKNNKALYEYQILKPGQAPSAQPYQQQPAQQQPQAPPQQPAQQPQQQPAGQGPWPSWAGAGQAPTPQPGQAPQQAPTSAETAPWPPQQPAQGQGPASDPWAGSQQPW